MSLFWIGCFVILGLITISGLIVFLLQIGVIVQKAGEAPHIDQGNYSMDQGREVKAEDQ
ncbi:MULTISPECIES: hypothetical protein [Herpetosiphon]|uniref:hypothetical protein n=1 Tax=Herpetosiphon TaxID=64 RepID=UPI00195B83B3|nr:hypothetical protein [Herpetosiphon giganteus]MBM7842040.1 hypothetical protein [Herpetosiphon giganteus]